MSRFGAESPRDLLLRPFFDCLHRDGVDLLDTPLAQRLAMLDAVVGTYRIPSVQDAAAALGLLDASLAAGHEGVMVKSLSAPYAAGRRGRVWQKVKPLGCRRCLPRRRHLGNHLTHNVTTSNRPSQG